MPLFRDRNAAFGFPGSPATWAPANKQAFGTGCSCGSRVWFTIADGILTEAFYPRTDNPQVREIQFVFTGGRDIFLEEKRDFAHQVERMAPAQGYRVRSSHSPRRFVVTKEVISSPTRSCIMVHTELDGAPELIDSLETFVLCTPHLDDSGSGNNAHIVSASGRELLAAERDGTWLVIDVSCGFAQLSCGYVGSSDGYSDLSKHRRMTFEFDHARQGNVMLTGQLDLAGRREFELGIAFGDTLEGAIAALFQSFTVEYEVQRRLFVHRWTRKIKTRRVAAHGRLADASRDRGQLSQASYALLLAAEDKTYEGAFVAAPATPWGQVRNDEQGRAGYHMVWTRDMVETSMALLAAGNTRAPLRALVNLAARQGDDGGFAQTSWVNGKTFAGHKQLDETAFPVLLAARLYRDQLLEHFQPSAMVRSAVRHLVLSGPVTGQERWEESSGYSPSTLASVISACVSAAEMLRAEGEQTSACVLEQYADFLVAHLEEWTVTTQGSLSPGIRRYFVRLNPVKPGEVAAPGDVDRAELQLPDQPPGAPTSYPARDVVDAGFLQLVRYGILSPRDPLIIDSLKVVDRTLMRTTARGKCWRRYNHDGYGQRPDGSPYGQWGQGGSWPLLTGERGHYELAAGGDFGELIEAMEEFSKPNLLLPEQIWDEADLPRAGMFSGQATGSARPLFWAHAEYLRLLRSALDGQVFELIAEVAHRYLQTKPKAGVEYWLHKHAISQARRKCSLRICAAEPFRLHWASGGEADWRDSDSSPTAFGVHFCDIDQHAVEAGVEFTFLWKGNNQWEGRNYRVQTPPQTED
jgi:glucoamylase